MGEMSFETEVLVRLFNVGGVPFCGGRDGGVDHRCSSVSKIRRHGHGAVIGNNQAGKKRG